MEDFVAIHIFIHDIYPKPIFNHHVSQQTENVTAPPKTHKTTKLTIKKFYWKELLLTIPSIDNV